MFQTTVYVRPEPYYGPEIPLGKADKCNLCPPPEVPPAPKEREWTVEEILAREG